MIQHIYKQLTRLAVRHLGTYKNEFMEFDGAQGVIDCFGMVCFLCLVYQLLSASLVELQKKKVTIWLFIIMFWDLFWMNDLVCLIFGCLRWVLWIGDLILLAALWGWILTLLYWTWLSIRLISYTMRRCSLALWFNVSITRNMALIRFFYLFQSWYLV